MFIRHLLFSCGILVWLLAGCAIPIDLPLNVNTEPEVGGATDSTSNLPDFPLYVLTRNAKGSDGLRYNELAIVDVDTWSIVRRTTLPTGAPWNIDRDPLGRLWVSYASLPGEGDNRVVVLSAEGELDEILRPCPNPYLGVHFNTEYAFVLCAMNGFYAKVVVLDLLGFTEVEAVEVVSPDRFGLVASDSIEGTILLYGAGAELNRVSLFDMQTYTVTATVTQDFSSIREIVHYEDDGVVQFYLLNVISLKYPEKSDALLRLDLTTPPTLTEVSLPVLGPTWGTIVGNQLYSYHNPQQGTTSDSPLRFISRLDLQTGDSAFWPLPDSWSSGDIVGVSSQIVLAHSVYEDPHGDSGLYEFNPETGELTQLLHLPGALRLLPTGP
ncbi:hypothetical protein GC175_06545 [bacterium]|nr:hypothetical protein [bacterium]